MPSIREAFRPRFSLSAYATDTTVIERAKTLVAYLYCALPIVAYLFLQQSLTGGMLRQNFDPLWPLAWTTWLSVEYPQVVLSVSFFFLVCSLIGALAFRHRTARILVFLSVWQVHAFESSFGHPDHPWYVFLYTSFILIWLPDIWKKSASSFDAKRIFLLVIWCAQALFMLFYTLAGLGKVIGIAYQWSVGEIHGLSLYGFAYMIADWLPRIQEPSVLGPFLIEHPWLSWSLFVISLFFQTFALWTMVRPSLQSLWAFELVLFHIGTYLVMGINFLPFVIALVLLFFHSPFSARFTWKDAAFDMPLFGPLLRLIQERFSRARR